MGAASLFDGHHEHDAWRANHLGGAIGTADDDVYGSEVTTACRSIRLTDLSSVCVGDLTTTVDGDFISGGERGADREAFETGTGEGNL